MPFSRLDAPAWRVAPLRPFLRAHCLRRAWLAGTRPRGSTKQRNKLYEVTQKLTGLEPAGWHVHVCRVADLYPAREWGAVGKERVLVIDVLVDQGIECWFDAWWAADFVGNVKLRVWDHEGLVLDDNILEWDVPDYHIACQLLAWEAEQAPGDVMWWGDDHLVEEVEPEAIVWTRPWSPERDLEDGE